MTNKRSKTGRTKIFQQIVKVNELLFDMYVHPSFNINPFCKKKKKKAIIEKGKKCWRLLPPRRKKKEREIAKCYKIPSMFASGFDKLPKKKKNTHTFIQPLFSKQR